MPFVLLFYLLCCCFWCCFCTVYGCSWLNSFCIIIDELSKHSNLRSIFGHFWLQKSIVAIKMLILRLQKQKPVSDILMLIFLVASVSRFLLDFFWFGPLKWKHFHASGTLKMLIYVLFLKLNKNKLFKKKMLIYESGKKPQFNNFEHLLKLAHQVHSKFRTHCITLFVLSPNYHITRHLHGSTFYGYVFSNTSYDTWCLF